jgi:hypothetical protein
VWCLRYIWTCVCSPLSSPCRRATPSSHQASPSSRTLFLRGKPPCPTLPLLAPCPWATSFEVPAYFSNTNHLRARNNLPHFLDFSINVIVISMRSINSAFLRGKPPCPTLPLLAPCPWATSFEVPAYFSNTNHLRACNNLPHFLDFSINVIVISMRSINSAFKGGHCVLCHFMLFTFYFS